MSPNFAAARLNMVESQVRPSDVTDVAIHDAMRSIPREDFCGGKLHLAYADTAVEFASGRFLMAPRELAKLLQSVRPRPGERALAIAAPYAAAVLRHIGLEVVETDATGTTPDVGAYDVIVSEGAVAETPPFWIQALKTGGRLGVVERNGPVGKALVYLKSDGDVGSRTVFDATPPYLAGHEPRKSFAF